MMSRMPSAGGAPGGAVRCRGCGEVAATRVLDLGEVPASDYFPPLNDPSRDPRWPLQLFVCGECALVQLGPSEHPEPEPPRAVESATALTHAARSAADIVATEGLHPGERVIEIDSHHGGSWLAGFTEAGLVERPGDESADLVVDVHGIAHEPDLAGPLAAHGRRIAPGGRLVLEFHHLLPMLEQSQIDTVRHGHFVYLSLIAMDRLLRRHDLVPTRAVPVDVFGGSLRLTAARAADDPAVDASVARVLGAERAAGLDGPAAVVRFGERGSRSARAFADHLRSLRDSGRSVAGYGAPSKAPVLLALAGVDESLLPYTVDLAPAKHGSRLPGTRIPILPPGELLARQPDEVAVLTWDIADEIVAQLSHAASGSDWTPRLYAPLPAGRYLAELPAPACPRPVTQTGDSDR
jgi:C-methyltransferase C-terminal domain/Putative zinc binding domain